MALPSWVRGAIHPCSPRAYIILVFKSFSCLSTRFGIFKFFKCSQQEENSRFLPYSFAKHFQSLVFSWSSSPIPNRSCRFHLQSSSRIQIHPLPCGSITPPTPSGSLLHTMTPLLATRGTFKGVGLSVLSY